MVWILILLAVIGIYAAMADGGSPWLTALAVIASFYIAYRLYKSFYPKWQVFREHYKQNKKKEELKRKMNEKGWSVIQGGRKFKV